MKKHVNDQHATPLREPSWISDAEGAHDRTLAETWLFRLRCERFRSRASGSVHDFFVAHLADGVHVLAVTPDQQVVMVRQFRAGSRRDSLEMPGGLLEPGEDPCAAGARELLEETGYAGDPSRLVGTLWPNPALLSMRITTIVVHNARRIAEPHPDQSEELAVEMVSVRDIRKLIETGRIDHAVCVAGLLWWLNLTATREIAQRVTRASRLFDINQPVARLAHDAGRSREAKAVRDSLGEPEWAFQPLGELKGRERFQPGAARRQKRPKVAGAGERGRTVNLTEAAVDNPVTRPAAARHPHLVDRDPQNLDVQVGVREDSHHTHQIVEYVDERALLRAAAC